MVNPSAQENSESTRGSSAKGVLEEVEVVAPRLDLQISPYIDPDIAIGADAISAMAVNDLGELLEQLEPELDGGRARATSSRVILLNGQRIANFREIRRYPSEAVARVDIYPEDVALQYGFRADQKVVNIVLKSQFRSLTTRITSTGYGENESGQGGEVAEADAGYLKVQGSARTNLDFAMESQSALHEADRDVPLPVVSRPASLEGNLTALDTELDAGLSAAAGYTVSAATLPADTRGLRSEDLLPTANSPTVTDVRPYRTLLPELTEQSLSGGYANLLGDRVTATLFAAYRKQERHTEQGLATLTYDVPAQHPGSPFSSGVRVDRLLPVLLDRDQSGDRYEVNTGLTGTWRGLGLSWLSAYTGEDRDASTVLGVDSAPLTDRIADLEVGFDPFTPDVALIAITQMDNTRIDSWSSELLARGTFRDLPAGPIQGSVRALWEYNSQKTSIRRDAQPQRNRIQRSIAGLRMNLDVPLHEFDSGGRLSLNINGDYADYSDFGGLSTVGAGVTWNPAPVLRLTSSLTQEENAPSMEQLGDPLTQLPNRRTFDFATGTAVDVDQISGGNPDLKAEVRNLWNINARVQLPQLPRLTLTFDYLQEITDNPIARFPQQNEALEAAFPERYDRDERGNLILIDTRAINLEEERRREFRWALRFTHDFKRAEPGTQGRKPRSSQGRGQNAVPGFGRRSGGNANSPRLRLSLNHAITLQDELTLSPGAPPIDFVGIARAGRRRDGAEHTINLRSTYAYRGFSARLNASWRAATATRPNSFGELHFDDLLRADINLAYAVQPGSGLQQRFPALAGSRVRFSVINALDSKTQVVDSSGLTPAGFSEDELVPRGRHFALEFRKQFK
ncbi:MAG: hypothetical protein AAFY29_12070 [Pseudomonadota bacterium]